MSQGEMSPKNSSAGAPSPSHALARGAEHGESHRADEPYPDDKFAPDLGEASRFIGALIRHDQPGEQYTYQTFDDSEEKRGHLAKVFHGRGNAAALTNANAEGAGVFITINATNGRGRREANIKRARAAFLDMDGKPLEPVL